MFPSQGGCPGRVEASASRGVSITLAWKGIRSRLRSSRRRGLPASRLAWQVAARSKAFGALAVPARWDIRRDKMAHTVTKGVTARALRGTSPSLEPACVRHRASHRLHWASGRREAAHGWSSRSLFEYGSGVGHGARQLLAGHRSANSQFRSLPLGKWFLPANLPSLDSLQHRRISGSLPSWNCNTHSNCINRGASPKRRPRTGGFSGKIPRTRRRSTI